MAITAEDEAAIDHNLNERYMLIPRDDRRRRWVSLINAIAALAMAAIIALAFRALAPICAGFEISLSIVSELAFGLWLPVTLAVVFCATVAKEFVSRLSHCAATWNLVAFWVGVVAAALSTVGAALAGVSLLQSLS